MRYSSLAQYLQKDRMIESRVEKYSDVIEIKTERLVCCS